MSRIRPATNKDGKYLESALRHQLMASGCLLAKDRDSSDVVVEARAGAVGVSRRALPASDRRLTPGHLHGAF